jgi:protein ImuB
MRRVISVYLPHWTMELRKRRLVTSGAWRPADAFVVAAQDGGQHTIVAVNDVAARHGIAPGMALSRARVIVPEVKSAPATPNTDATALMQLSIRALRYSPLVAPCAPDGLWIDATGVAHLFGDEDAMTCSITKRLRAIGFTARTAMAGTPGAAWAWARYGSGNPVLTPGDERRALDALPLAALRLPRDVVQALRHSGLKSVADLRRIPRATIPIRFGADVLQRLDQALGHAPEAIAPILPPRAKRQQHAFAEPIGTPEDLARTIDILVKALCTDLETSAEGARKLDLVFTRTDNKSEIIRLGTARPTRDATHLTKLLTEKLSTVDPGFGIEAATLTAWRVGPLKAVQLSADGQAADTAQDIGALVDRLSNRVGARNVFKFAAVPSDIPERAAVAVSPMTRTERAWPRHWPRPMRLFSPPEPVNVMALLPDYPPARFRWRDRLHNVRGADGPERIFGEWWKGPNEVGEVRDYFRIENESGERYWLYRVEKPGHDAQWYVHGVFA